MGKQGRKPLTTHEVWFMAKLGEGVSYQGSKVVMATSQEAAERKVRKELHDEYGATLVIHHPDESFANHPTVGETTGLAIPA